jgi:hypothetical protein
MVVFSAYHCSKPVHDTDISGGSGIDAGWTVGWSLIDHFVTNADDTIEVTILILSTFIFNGYPHLYSM